MWLLVQLGLSAAMTAVVALSENLISATVLLLYLKSNRSRITHLCYVRGSHYLDSYRKMHIIKTKALKSPFSVFYAMFSF